MAIEKFYCAFEATRALGIPDDEVKPILKKLLKVYDMNWDLIESENFRVLIDAYFEYKELRGTGDASKSNDAEIVPRGFSQRLLPDHPQDQITVIASHANQIIPFADVPLDTYTESAQLVTGSDSGRVVLHKKLKNFIAAGVPHSIENPVPFSSCLHNVVHPFTDTVLEKKNLSMGHIGKVAECKINMISNDFVCLENPPLVPHPSGDHHLLDWSSMGNCGRFTPPKHGVSGFNDFNSERGVIATSASQQAKILWRCNCPIEQADLQIPEFDAVMRYLEAKHPERYKLISSLHLSRLLSELCEYYWELFSASNNKYFPKCASPPQVGCGVVRKKLVSESNKSYEADSQLEKPVSSGTQFCGLHDITKGTEKVKIPLVDEFGNEDLPQFTYIPQNLVYQNAYVQISLARIADVDCCSSCAGDCLSSSIPCACARETGGEFAYTREGLLKEEFLDACISMKKKPQEHHFVFCHVCPLERLTSETAFEKCKGHLVRKFIKECWRKCGCDLNCGNRVVQRGITRNVQVYVTHEGKGWGLRTLEKLQKGTFVCEYVGEILTNAELFERNMRNGNERHTYPVTLDADWGSEKILRDEEALCLDATLCGNVARFVNHRCEDATMIDIPVEVDTPDRHYYHLAFFTTRDVNPLEELNWDYGIDFDDNNHPVKAFKCCCGSLYCRDAKRRVARARKRHR